MRRPWHIWIAFGVCVAISLAAVGRLSLRALELDRAELRARRQAALEEKLRLALWRMDSVVSPLVMRENARSHAADRTNEQAALGEHVSRYFRWDGVQRRGPFSDRLAAIASRLPEPEVSQRSIAQIVVPEAPQFKEQARQQAALNKQEFQVRSQIAASNAMVPQEFPFGEPVQVAPLTPLWIGSDLVLARKVRENGATAIEGCVLDWPSLRGELLAVVRDLLPAAQLQPAAEDEETHRLALLPVQLKPGLVPESPAVLSPIHRSLLVTWGVLGLAIVAAGFMLRTVISLSERRAAFVSAVTHELRTPLTTFRMYAEMLAEGMVAGETQRREYLATLQAEADRLMHLIENVLAYARLERNPASLRREPLPAGEMLDRITLRLSERASRSGLDLVVETDEDARGRTVLTHAASVEQILLNLVDNACKYAASAQDRRVHLLAGAGRDCVQLRIRDHGPGIPSPVQLRLFRPFHRSASEAAQSAPGVGLGLAFSRRLARALGGDLRLDREVRAGAGFVLVLPAIEYDE